MWRPAQNFSRTNAASVTSLPEPSTASVIYCIYQYSPILNHQFIVTGHRCSGEIFTLMNFASVILFVGSLKTFERNISARGSMCRQEYYPLITTRYWDFIARNYYYVRWRFSFKYLYNIKMPRKYVPLHFIINAVYYYKFYVAKNTCAPFRKVSRKICIEIMRKIDFKFIKGSNSKVPI